jgi:hypothetical protein
MTTCPDVSATARLPLYYSRPSLFAKSGTVSRGHRLTLTRHRLPRHLLALLSVAWQRSRHPSSLPYTLAGMERSLWRQPLRREAGCCTRPAHAAVNEIHASLTDLPSLCSAPIRPRTAITCTDEDLEWQMRSSRAHESGRASISLSLQAPSLRQSGARSS